MEFFTEDLNAKHTNIKTIYNDKLNWKNLSMLLECQAGRLCWWDQVVWLNEGGSASAFTRENLD